jgi:3-methyladenine DNA glycosylase AlkC
MTSFKIPAAPASIKKDIPLKDLLGTEAIACLAHNIQLVQPSFDAKSFGLQALTGLAELGILQRGQHIAQALRAHLPSKYADAVEVLLGSLTPANVETEGLGLAVFFYLPHTCFVAQYGLSHDDNLGEDPFEVSMRAQYALTKRFTAEYSIRPFLIAQTERTLLQLSQWINDPDPHVRRLCSEGTRPRLPWAMRLPAFVADPSPALPILEALKNDPSLYVRRSVANHLGDIAKDHAELAFAICARWLENADSDLRWVIRHALRHPAKKGNKTALALRQAAK